MNLAVINAGKTKFIIAEELLHAIHNDMCETSNKSGHIIIFEPEDISYCCGLSRNGIKCFINTSAIDKYYVLRRGGLATIHSPGQIVCYVLVNLDLHSMSLDTFIYKLEQCMIDFLKTEFSINATRSNINRGCFLNGDKIGFIGVGVKRNITMYGFSINICNDINLFKHIIPCGLHETNITSASSILSNNTITINEGMMKSMVNNVSELFRYNEAINTKHYT